jgi:HlyD family secretion protein
MTAARSALRPALLVAALLALAGCTDRSAPPAYQGWVEADFVFVGPDEPGRVVTEAVREGDAVAAGAPLFALDDDLQQADLAQIRASVDNARQAFERAEKLLRTSAGTQMAYDNTQAALREAEARLNSAQTRLTRRRIASPAAGVVQQIYFRPGEMVSAGRPVLALLPPAHVKVRFYVPEAALPRIAHGDPVDVHCDGCAGGLTARISFIASSAEYTPPVIYSLEERAKLVFLVEALPAHPEALRVGQPLSVALPVTEAVKEAKR